MIQRLEPGPNGTRPEPEPLQHISASSVKLYLSCSLRYFFKKVLCLPEPTSPSLHLGKAVHSGLQAFHKARWRGESHDRDTVIGAYETALCEQQEKDPVEFPDDAAREKLHTKGVGLLDAYLESDHARMPDIPLGVEVHLEADLDTVPSPVVGYVDLVRQGNVPVDYKTCASTPNVELEAHQHELQMTLYQLLIEECTGERVEGRELVFLVKTKKPKVITHRLMPATQREKQRALDITMAAVDGIYHERYYPQPGMQCSWCDFRAHCSQWTEGGVR